MANDNTIAFGGLRLPIPPGSDRRNHVRAKVDVYLHYSGTLTVEHEGARLVEFIHDASRPVRVDHFTPAGMAVLFRTPEGVKGHDTPAQAASCQ